MTSVRATAPSAQTRAVVPLRRAQGKACRRTGVPSGRARDGLKHRHRRSAGRLEQRSFLLFCVALFGRGWGAIDVVASATGKIVPSGRTKVIQPFETGVVRSIQSSGRASGQGGRIADRTRPRPLNAAERDHLRNDLVARTAQYRALTRRTGCRRNKRSGVLRRQSAQTRYLIATQRQLLLNQSGGASRQVGASR